MTIGNVLWGFVLLVLIVVSVWTFAAPEVTDEEHDRREREGE